MSLLLIIPPKPNHKAVFAFIFLCLLYFVFSYEGFRQAVESVRLLLEGRAGMPFEFKDATLVPVGIFLFGITLVVAARNYASTYVSASDQILSVKKLLWGRISVAPKVAYLWKEISNIRVTPSPSQENSSQENFGLALEQESGTVFLLNQLSQQEATTALQKIQSYKKNQVESCR